MRIALVIDHFNARRGGASQWTGRFAAWLASRGHEVSVLSRSFGEVERELAVRRYLVPAGKSRFAFGRHVNEMLREIHADISHDMGAAWGCDIFHPHEGAVRACWDGAVAALGGWRRTVKRTMLRFAPRYRQIQRLLPKQYGECQRLIAVSQRVARDLEAEGVSSERIATIYNGVDLEQFSPALREPVRPAARRMLGIAECELCLLAVAHHFRLKGIPRLVKAFEALRKLGLPVRLLVCGGPRTSDGLPRFEGGVVYTGPLESSSACYAAADMVAHPTHYDACSLVTLEALAAGLPVVTTDSNGAAELMCSGANGVVAPGNISSEELAQTILPLVSDPALRLRLGADGRRLALEHSQEQNFREVFSLYESLRPAPEAVEFPMGRPLPWAEPSRSVPELAHEAV